MATCRKENTMQIESSQSPSVPWTTRDVWLGLVVSALWLTIFLVVAVWVQHRSLDLDLGLLVSLGELALLVPVWWLTVRKYNVGWRALGLRSFKGAMVGLGCGLMILSSIFNLFYSLFLALFGLRMQVDLAPLFAELDSPWWLLAGGVIVAPVVEEVFFRGFVFAGLRQRYDWKKAALISSALFAVIHVTPTAMIPIFILGLIFAYLYHRSNSIWPAVLMHVSTNALALGLAYLVANVG
ncbi:MAG: CPBP family intramembrane metalloprotease [Chloroflexi bacterium]|nr:CPBP family intramembrane metalloprotease [Chloroflexota bacterium]